MIKFKCPGGVYNATPPRIIFGSGSVESIKEEVKHIKCSRVLVVSTPGRKVMAENVVSALGELCVKLYPEAISQVPIESAINGRKTAKDVDADCIVAIGGGASIGLAKGISYELALPIIDIATTYSGSEVTGFCGMTINGIKHMHQSINMLAKTLIYDPKLTLSLPISISAASAMNALAHCVDCVYTPTVNPSIICAAALGAKYVSKAVKKVVKTPYDLDAREELLFGSYLSGVALTGGFALQHGIAHTLGGTFGIEHGLAHSLTLPYSSAYNAKYASEALEPISEALKCDPHEIGGNIYDLRKEIGLPSSLKEVGFKEIDLERLIEITVETDNGQNPVPASRKCVSEVVMNMWNGERPR